MPSDPPSRGRRVIFRTIAAVAGLFAAVLGAEVIFRVFEIRPPEPPPADQVDAFRVKNELNSLGLRAPEGFPPPRAAGQFRIAVLGDSMTYGEGVEAHEAFPAVMEGLLDRGTTTLPSAAPGLVINMGKLGDDTRDELVRFQQLADRADPDLVILVMYVNDFVGAGDPGEALHHIYDLRDSLSPMAELSSVYRYAERKARMRMAFNETVRYYRADAERGVEPEALRPVREAVLELNRAVQARKARLVVAMMPWLIRLSDYPLKKMHAAVESMCRDAGIPFIDLIPAVAGQDDEAMRVSPANHHPSRAAHQRIAEYLAEQLRRNRLLP